MSPQIRHQVEEERLRGLLEQARQVHVVDAGGVGSADGPVAETEGIARLLDGNRDVLRRLSISMARARSWGVNELLLRAPRVAQQPVSDIIIKSAGASGRASNPDNRRFGSLHGRLDVLAHLDGSPCTNTASHPGACH